MNYQRKPRYFTRPRAGGKVAHYLDLGKIKGKLKQVKYDTKAEALADIPKIMEKRREDGNNSLALDDSIIKAEVGKCLTLLKPHGITLLEASKFYIKVHGEIPSILTTITQGVDLWEKAKLKRGNRAKSTAKTVDTYYLPFKKAFPESQAIGTLPTDDITKYLDSHDKWSALTYNNHIRNLSGLYKFLQRQKVVAFNPLELIDLKKQVEADKKILQIAEVKKALQYCLDEEKYNLIAYMVLVLFCGIRPDEARLVKWSSINWEKKIISVTKGIAKKSKQRTNPIPANAIIWLEKVKENTEKAANEKGTDMDTVNGSPIVENKGLTEAMKRMWKAVDIKYPQNAMRHSFATFDFLNGGSAAETSEKLGHPTTNLLHTTYKEFGFDKRDGEKYYKILPKGMETVLDEVPPWLLAQWIKSQGGMSS